MSRLDHSRNDIPTMARGGRDRGLGVETLGWSWLYVGFMSVLRRFTVTSKGTKGVVYAGADDRKWSFSGNLTRAQTVFLRDYMESGSDDVSVFYPSPGIFRRWMRGEAFRAALRRVQETQRMQADLNLASAAAVAAQMTRELVASATCGSGGRTAALDTLRDLIEVIDLGRSRVMTPVVSPAPKSPATAKASVETPGTSVVESSRPDLAADSPVADSAILQTPSLPYTAIR